MVSCYRVFHGNRRRQFGNRIQTSPDHSGWRPGRRNAFRIAFENEISRVKRAPESESSSESRARLAATALREAQRERWATPETCLTYRPTCNLTAIPSKEIPSGRKTPGMRSGRKLPGL